MVTAICWFFGRGDAVFIKLQFKNSYARRTCPAQKGQMADVVLVFGDAAFGMPRRGRCMLQDMRRLNSPVQWYRQSLQPLAR